MDRAAKSLMCAFGAGCKHGLNCHRGHTGVEKKIFADKKEIREKEWMAPCAFCAVGAVQVWGRVPAQYSQQDVE